MPRYSLQELIARQSAGQIGRRGLKRLAEFQGAQVSSGVDPGLAQDPNADLAARRASLYANAVEAAHSAAPGTELSAGIQRRLALGAGGPNSATTFAPHNAAEVQSLAPQYNTILEALKKRSLGIQSQAGIYR